MCPKGLGDSYITHGVRLGWLIDRNNQRVWVYRDDGSVTQYPATAILDGEDVVPGFTVVLKFCYEGSGFRR